MNQEIMNLIEQKSSNRDFFVLHKDKVLDSFDYLDNILSRYVDLCCHKYETFEIVKLSYIYGSIKTLAISMILSAEKHFGSLDEKVLSYLIETFLPIFINEYRSETLVTTETQNHFLKSNIEDYLKVRNGTEKFLPNVFDKYLNEKHSKELRYYFRDIITYCVDHKKCDATQIDVAKEIISSLEKVFD